MAALAIPIIPSATESDGVCGFWYAGAIGAILATGAFGVDGVLFVVVVFLVVMVFVAGVFGFEVGRMIFLGDFTVAVFVGFTIWFLEISEATFTAVLVESPDFLETTGVLGVKFSIPETFWISTNGNI